MPGVNRNGLNRENNLFRSEKSTYHMDYQSDYLSNCSGTALLELNACISGIDSMMQNINSLYEATGRYLDKVEYNFNACEADNTAMGSN